MFEEYRQSEKACLLSLVAGAVFIVLEVTYSYTSAIRKIQLVAGGVCCVAFLLRAFFPE